ncbi:high frequency lysogenization protein HflD [Cocleimonas flava]|uniref:High frequency lysogenization protein HflD homolog n=1 Tax=Cocleimonas flava TaxID=634765 RepID=A0A4R1F8K3_9GAMM|nr:high frequency lysogenization protein HflD [Cocleimonas flava]TCJ87071.1 high frequency lysogenization protein [Cocleimonas flava]
MESNTQNRAIALAAVFQCVDGVSQVANTGKVDDTLFNTCINSVLNDNAGTAVELYGSLDNLKTGLTSMLYQLGSGQMTPDGKAKDMEATRYALGLLHLEKKLNNNPEMFQQLLQGIQDTQKKLEFFDVGHENITASLAEIYTNTVSKIGPKIMVKGEQSHLANPANASKIRALLLAGIRAALLWRQAGGNRWKLLIERGKLQKQADSYLNSL